MTPTELAAKHHVTPMMISFLRRPEPHRIRTTDIKLAKDMAKYFGGSPKDYFSKIVLKRNPSLERQLLK